MRDFASPTLQILPAVGFVRRYREASYVTDDIADLLVFEQASPGGHERGFPDPGSAPSDNFLEIFVGELVHNFAIRMVGRFNR